MHWSALILVTAGLAAGTTNDTVEFASYGDAWHKAAEVKRPMLVILNPSQSQVATGEQITIDTLRQDEQISQLLDKYVVSIVDTGTEEGKKVHAVFGNKPLPYVAVIDENQKKQVFQKSEEVTTSEILTVLTKYQDGAVKVQQAELSLQINPPGYCPNCQKNQQYFGF